MANFHFIFSRKALTVFILVGLTIFVCKSDAFQPTCSTLFNSQVGLRLGPFDARYDEDFLKVLREFRGSDDTTIDRQLRGGEGQIFLSSSQPFLALKRFFRREKQDPWYGIRLLEDARASIESKDELSNLIEIARVYEKGSDWVLRDYDSSSVPLKQILHDYDSSSVPLEQILHALAVKTRGGALRNLYNSKEPALIRLKNMLERNPPSINVHWSRSKKKILIFDLTKIMTALDLKTV
ncbi:MAG: hypothetical protein A4S09_11040 [Proteobacteria bacterium SG_bin7]|nr:MAG: hypothetical protein A4S09_11040 [Proteobacteria bacterium SG_bin7]